MQRMYQAAFNQNTRLWKIVSDIVPGIADWRFPPTRDERYRSRTDGLADKIVMTAPQEPLAADSLPLPPLGHRRLLVPAPCGRPCRLASVLTRCPTFQAPSTPWAARLAATTPGSAPAKRTHYAIQLLPVDRLGYWVSGGEV